MNPVTQMLRAFTWPDRYEKKPRTGKPRNKEKSAFEQQLDDMEAVRAALGDDAWPWFGPTIILDTETPRRATYPVWRRPNSWVELSRLG